MQNAETGVSVSPVSWRYTGTTGVPARQRGEFVKRGTVRHAGKGPRVIVAEKRANGERLHPFEMGSSSFAISFWTSFIVSASPRITSEFVRASTVAAIRLPVKNRNDDGAKLLRIGVLQREDAYRLRHAGRRLPNPRTKWSRTGVSQKARIVARMMLRLFTDESVNSIMREDAEVMRKWEAATRQVTKLVALHRTPLVVRLRY